MAGLTAAGGLRLESMSRPASILVLEDDPYRIEIFREMFAPLTIYATDFVPDFILRAERGSWRMILLDHDLDVDGEAPTGADAARQLGDASSEAFQACCYAPVVVHSINLHGAGDIVKALWAWEGPVVRVPFHRLPEFGDWLKVLTHGWDGARSSAESGEQ